MPFSTIYYSRIQIWLEILKFAEMGDFAHPKSARSLTGYTVTHQVTGTIFFSQYSDKNWSLKYSKVLLLFKKKHKGAPPHVEYG